jgi:hypothetical protein
MVDVATPNVKVPVIVMSVFEDVETVVAFGAPIEL